MKRICLQIFKILNGLNEISMLKPGGQAACKTDMALSCWINLLKLLRYASFRLSIDAFCFHQRTICVSTYSMLARV